MHVALFSAPVLCLHDSLDCTLKIWDTNDRRSGLTIQAHQFEVLTCDWNKYNEFLISTGSVDKSIRTWVRAHTSSSGGQVMHAMGQLQCGAVHAEACLL